jgi:hypothetical protein
MYRLSPQEIIGLWETGQALSPVDQALAILELACPEASRDELGSLTIGRRDARLFRIYRETFRPVLSAASVCPGCREVVEFEFDTRNVESAEGPDDGVFDYSADGFRARYRLPNSLDLAEAMSASGPGEMRAALLQRCLIEADQGGMTPTAAQLPESVAERLAADMSGRDPGAEILVDLRCPACGREWQDLLDIVTFLRADIRAEAQRLLYEVHTLASTYGWSEKDILDMSPARRHFYMELIV